MKKYALTNETMVTKNGTKLYRIVSLSNFSDVKVGDLGGWVQSESNLSHDGCSWIYDDGRVFGYASVCGDAKVCDNANVFGYAWLYGNAKVFGNSKIYGDSCIYGDAKVYDNAKVYGNAYVFGNDEVCGDTILDGKLTSDTTNEISLDEHCELTREFIDDVIEYVRNHPFLIQMERCYA